jgi:hypothetical protein
MRREGGLEREAAVAAIVSAYLSYVRSMGFLFVHFRAPPPHDDDCQIFARRPDEQRVTWTLYMTRWLHRILQYAQANGSIHSYTCGSLSLCLSLARARSLSLSLSRSVMET